MLHTIIYKHEHVYVTLVYVWRINESPFTQNIYPVFVVIAYYTNSTPHFHILTNNLTQLIILNTWFAINKTSITKLYQNALSVNTNIS